MIHVANPEIERLAERLARARGVSAEVAILQALQEAERGEARRPRQMDGEAAVTRRARMAIVLDRYAKRPLLDARSADDIIGYGDDGIPA